MIASATDPNTDYCCLHTHTLAISKQSISYFIPCLVSRGISIVNKNPKSLSAVSIVDAIQYELEMEEASASGWLEAVQ